MQFLIYDIDRRQRWLERLPHAVEVALVLLLAAQAARLVWMLALPPTAVGDDDGIQASAAAAPATLSLSGDPFFRSTQAPRARDAALGYRLFAVRRGPGSGSAILAGKDGAQAAYHVGDTVADGVVLQAVTADHAILRADGADHRLSLQTDPPASASNPAPHRASAMPSARPAPAAGTDAEVDARQLLTAAGLRPRAENGRVNGYTLIGRGDTALLREAGLEPGDVLLTINGQQLNAERMSELEQELASRDQVRLTVQRNGETKNITLRTKQP